MSIIKARLDDNILTLINTPAVASGAIETNEIEFEFDGNWNGYIKTAVFYASPSEVYYAMVTDDRAMIPSQAIEHPGTMFFGVFGIAGDTRKTSTVLPYQVVQGAFKPGVTPPDPTPDIYTQILTAFNDLTTGDTYLINGVIEQNDGNGLRFWLGTQAEYDALTDLVPNCLYIITDDTARAEIDARITALEQKNVELWTGSAESGTALTFDGVDNFKMFAVTVGMNNASMLLAKTFVVYKNFNAASETDEAVFCELRSSSGIVSLYDGSLAFNDSGAVFTGTVDRFPTPQQQASLFIKKIVGIL